MAITSHNNRASQSKSCANARDFVTVQTEVPEYHGEHGITITQTSPTRGLGHLFKLALALINRKVIRVTTHMSPNRSLDHLLELFPCT